MVLSLKELKAKLEDNDLNLSLCELDSVPVREIAQLKKAPCLDLSSNRLRSLNDEFSVRLNYLVRLDLSQNALAELPDNFGLLVNLQHLDLYKNQLQTLPLSMDGMAALKFLDISDNPLDLEFQSVVGLCSDEKECQKAARGLVAYLKRKREQISREQSLEKRAKERAQQLEHNAAGAENSANALKNRNKKKKKSAHEHADSRETNDFGSRPAEQPSSHKTHQHSKKERKHRRGGVFGCCVRATGWLLKTLFVLLCVALGLLWLLHWCCASGAGGGGRQYLSVAQCQTAFTQLLSGQQLAQTYADQALVQLDRFKVNILSYLHV